MIAGGSVAYYIGGMKEKDLKISETKQVILATYSMAAEALDIKTLTTLFLLTPKTDVQQAVGRILRVKHSKPLVVDFIDVHSIFQNQWKKRKVFYNKQNYNIKYTNSDIYNSKDNSVFNENTWKNMPKHGDKQKKKDVKCEIILE